MPFTLDSTLSLASRLARPAFRIPSARTRLMLASACLISVFAGPAVAQTATEAAATETRPASELAADTDADEEAEATPAAERDAPEGDSEVGDGEAAEEEYEWFTNEQGDRYRIATLPKVEGTFSRPREGWARFPGGATFQVEEESDDTFWVRVFDRNRPDRRRPSPSTFGKKPSAEEIAEIEARYEFELEQVDRLELQPFHRGLPQKGQWRDGFDLADMNEDGHLDIVFGPARKNAPVPSIFLGDGEGNWRRWAEASFPRAAYDYGDAAVGDWNGDGHLDLALGVHLRGILALVGDGQGNFELASDGLDFDVPGSRGKLSAFASKALAAVDWNADGKTDILALGEGPKRNTGNPNEIMQGSVGFRVHLSQGDGSWTAVRLSPSTDRNFGNGFALLDVNGDGQQDVVTATSQLNNTWLVLESTSPMTAEIAQLEDLPENAVVDTVTSGDINLDGKDDLVLTYRATVLGKWRSGIDVLLRSEDGWERHGVLSLLQREPFRAVAVGHADGDEVPDLAALDDFGLVRILLGNGDGSFAEELVTETPGARIGCQGYDVELRDLDGDGLDDVIAAFAGEAQGMAAFTGSAVSGCKGGGRLSAWKVSAKEAPQT